MTPLFIAFNLKIRIEGEPDSGAVGISGEM